MDFCTALLIGFVFMAILYFKAPDTFSAIAAMFEDIFDILKAKVMSWFSKK